MSAVFFYARKDAEKNRKTLNKEKSRSIRILALDPSKENRVTILLSKIDSGETLAANDRDGILVSYWLADELKIKPGDEATVVFEKGKARVFTIRGILRTGMTMDANTVIINFDSAAEELNLNNKASVIFVKLSDEALSGQYKTKISEELEMQKVKEWKQEVESLVSSTETFKEIFAIINAVGLFTGAVSVGVILYINILHKRRQIGILKAMGMKDLQVLSVYILEAVFLGTIGILIGDALGYAGTKYLEAHPFPDPILGSMAPRFYTYLLYDASLVTMLTVLFAAVYPAFVAGRMNMLRLLTDIQNHQADALVYGAPVFNFNLPGMLINFWNCKTGMSGYFRAKEEGKMDEWLKQNRAWKVGAGIVQAGHTKTALKHINFSLLGECDRVLTGMAAHTQRWDEAVKDADRLGKRLIEELEMNKGPYPLWQIPFIKFLLDVA